MRQLLYKIVKIKNPPDARERVYSLVSQIPPGNVMTYGDIATVCGLNTPRIVGHYLHVNPNAQTIPCHRVVNAAGKLAPHFAFGGSSLQRQLLSQEGVTFKGDTVVLSRHRWFPS